MDSHWPEKEPSQGRKTYSMRLHGRNFAIAAAFLTIVGCSANKGQQSGKSGEVGMQSSRARETKVDARNEFGFAKISIREADNYEEGIVNAQGNQVVQASSSMLVNDITGQLALVQFERKFLFVPLDQGFFSSEDLESVDGFQCAEPYRCGFALVSVNDTHFYIDTNFQKAFDTDFEFAESFHHDRALVKNDGRYRIIDTQGKTVADLNYDQVNLQSTWCWQVTKIEEEKYRNGFVDLNGNLITELNYDYVGYYDSEVMRILVVRNERRGFLDEHAKVVIPVEFEYAEVFARGKARVMLNGRAYFINPDGVEVPE